MQKLGTWRAEALQRQANIRITSVEKSRRAEKKETTGGRVDIKSKKILLAFLCFIVRYRRNVGAIFAIGTGDF